VPKGWEVKRLDELTLFIKDGTHGTHADVENGIPLLSAKDIENGNILLENNPRLISVEDYSQIHKKYAIEEGDVLLTVVGTIGRLAIVQTKKTFTLQRSVAIIRASKTTSNIFLYCAMQSERFFNQLLLRTNASAQGGIYLGELAKCTLPCPQDSAEQQKIATILSTLDRTIEATKKLIDKEKMVKKGLMADLLTNGIDEQGRIRSPQTHTYVDSPLGMIPEGWEVKTLGSISTKMTNGFVGVATPFYVENNGVPYLYGNNIRPNKVQLEKTSLVSLEFHEKQVKSQLKPNDMLTVQSGHIGTSAIVPDGISEINCHALIITRFNQKYVLSQFISYYINSSIGMKQMSHYFVGSTILHINVGDLKKYHVPLPAKYEQEKIVAVLASQDRKIETEETNLAKLQNLKKGLMGDLLSGKVRVKI
jgi:type I restriction enzyme, S subunit